MAEKVQFSDLKTNFPQFKGNLMHFRFRQSSIFVISFVTWSDLFFPFLCGVAPPSGKCQDVGDALQFTERLHKQKKIVLLNK